jgi:hypothetical protein
MGLKVKVDEFLQSVTIMRKTAIDEAVQQALQTKHEPYKAQMVATRDKALVAEEQEFRRVIEQITAEHNNKVSTIKADFDGAIASHKASVAQLAEESAKGEYDKFILQVSAIADDIKIN